MEKLNSDSLVDITVIIQTLNEEKTICSRQLCFQH